MTKEELRIWSWVSRRCDWLSVEDAPLVFEFVNVSRLLFDCRKHLSARIGGEMLSQVRTYENSLSQRQFKLMGELGVSPMARTRLLQFQKRGQVTVATEEVDANEALRAKYFGD